MKTTLTLCLCLSGTFLLLSANPARALIPIKFPVARMYADAKAVRAAQVVAVDAGAKMVEVKRTATFKGEPGPERLRLQIVAPADVFPRVAVGQSVALFLGGPDAGGAAIVHLADTWLFAQEVPDASPLTLNVVQKYDAARSFPGSGAALVRCLAVFQAGESPLDDKIEAACLAGEARELANLKVAGTFLETVDLDRDTRGAILIGAADGVCLLVAAQSGYTDATAAWGLQGVRADHAAFGDLNGDGNPDLLLGASLYLRRGAKFARAEVAPELPPETDWVALGIAAAANDRKAAMVVLRKNGELLEFGPPATPNQPWTRTARALWTGGADASAACFSTHWGETGQLCVMVVRGPDVTRYPVAADGPPATTPYAQLTGEAWPNAVTLDGAPAGSIRAVALDCDGNEKLDWLVLAGNTAVAMLNRGFGVFCVDTAVIPPRLWPEKDKARPFVITPRTLLAGGQRLRGDPPRQNLLVLTETGRLYEVRNMPPAAP